MNVPEKLCDMSLSCHYSETKLLFNSPLTGKPEHPVVVTYNQENQMRLVEANKTITNASSDASKNQDGHLYYIVPGVVGGVVFLVVFIGIVVFVWLVSFIRKSISISGEEIYAQLEREVM